MRGHRLLSSASLVIVLLLGPALRAEDEKTATLAEIKLAGAFDEQPVADDPLFGTSLENFQSKLDRIKKAKTDEKVHGLYLNVDGLEIGWGKLHELRAAIVDFKKSGKKVYAYIESASTKEYLLAIACDEVVMPESGWLLVNGLQAEASFYKDLLENIGVKADMLQMGDFKGAAEPYTRNSMSKELRQQIEAMLDDIYEKELVANIAASRKLDAAKVKKLIDEGPFTAQGALEAKLIDRVAYPDTFNDQLKKDLKVARVRVFADYGKSKSKDIDLSNPFAFFKLFAAPKSASSDKPKVAVIYASGVIMTGKSSTSLLGGETCGAATMLEAIKKAEEDDTVKAIVLRVDSPGGSALASDLIWNALVKCKKPVIASMSDVAASGGYYISMAGKKIYAEPGTITGSIGVVGGKLVTGGLYDKIGIKTEVIRRGQNAGVLSPTTPFSDSERKVFTAMMKDIYKQFVDKAIQGRERAGKKFDRDDFLKLAEGRIWTGRQAKDKNLIDELGTLDDAVACAWKEAGMGADTKPEILALPKPKTFIELMLDSGETQAPGLSLPVGLKLTPELRGHLRHAGGLLHLKGEPVWAILPCRVQVR